MLCLPSYKRKKYQDLAQKLIRGFSSWILASSRSSSDNPQVLLRSFYPPSFQSQENSRNIIVDYEPSRPGIYNDVAEYVHVEKNPFFGEIYVKNNRSIDDIGQMIRAMTQVQTCKDIFDPEVQADLNQMTELYSDWSTRVENARFVIPTFNTKAEIYDPVGSIGDFNKYNFLGFDPNCAGKLALHLMHDNSSYGFDCGNGISALERVIGSKLQNDAIEIIRSHHIAGILMSEKRSLKKTSEKLKEGLAKRLDQDLQIARNPGQYTHFDIQDIAAEFVHANNAGVSLTSDEIRFVYEKLHQAYLHLKSPLHYATFHLFDDRVKDGEYSYDAPGIGLYFYTLAPMIGSCSSGFTKTDTRQLFDCEKVRATLSEP